MVDYNWNNSNGNGKSPKEIAKLNNSGKHPVCGGTKNNGELCNQNAGFRTSHSGEGRCLDHENLSGGVATKEFEIASIKDRMQVYLDDPRMMTLDREIALVRAYMEVLGPLIAVVKSDIETIKMMKSFPDMEEVETSGLHYDIGSLTAQLLNCANTSARLIKTKHEIEVGRKLVIDIRSVHLIVGTIMSIIDKNVLDIEVRENINQALNAIALPMAEM